MTKPSQINKAFVSHYLTTEIPSNFQILSLSDLDNTSDDSIEEIFVTDVIGGFADHSIGEFFKRLTNKLKVGGHLFVQDIDIEQFSVYLSEKTIPVGQKNILYIHKRTNVFYMRYIVNVIRQIPALKIEQMNFINGYEFFLKIKKNAS